jgi:hypothetical protein
LPALRIAAARDAQAVAAVPEIPGRPVLVDLDEQQHAPAERHGLRGRGMTVLDRVKLWAFRVFCVRAGQR